MRPAADFTKADQQRLRSLSIEKSFIPPPGRVMFRAGRKILGHGDVSKLGDFMYIPKQTDTICVSPADYSDVMGWIW